MSFSTIGVRPALISSPDTLIFIDGSMRQPR